MTPPDDLAAEGRALWDAMHAWAAAEEHPVRPHELPILAALCRTVDRLAHLRSEYEYAKAVPVWTKLSSEERQLGLTYARLIGSLGWPTGPLSDSGDPSTSKSRRGKKAAAKRWHHDKADPDEPTPLADYRAL